MKVTEGLLGFGVLVYVIEGSREPGRSLRAPTQDTIVNVGGITEISWMVMACWIVREVGYRCIYKL